MQYKWFYIWLRLHKPYHLLNSLQLLELHLDTCFRLALGCGMKE